MTTLLTPQQREQVRALLTRVASDKHQAMPSKPQLEAALLILDEELHKAIAAAATRLGPDAAAFDTLTRYRAAMEITKKAWEVQP